MPTSDYDVGLLVFQHPALLTWNLISLPVAMQSFSPPAKLLNIFRGTKSTLV